MSRHMVRRAVRPRPLEFVESLDAGMHQAQLRVKFAAGDATINRWRDEVYIERAEKIAGVGKK